MTQNTLCVDIDECALNTDGCAGGEHCINTAGGVTCSPCPEGEGIVDE